MLYEVITTVTAFPVPVCNATTELQCAGSPITVAENGGEAVSWKWTSNNANVTFDNDRNNFV